MRADENSNRRWLKQLMIGWFIFTFCVNVTVGQSRMLGQSFELSILFVIIGFLCLAIACYITYQWH